jgi:hypothetical protein
VEKGVVTSKDITNFRAQKTVLFQDDPRYQGLRARLGSKPGKAVRVELVPDDPHDPIVLGAQGIANLQRLLVMGSYGIT